MLYGDTERANERTDPGFIVREKRVELETKVPHLLSPLFFYDLSFDFG